MDAATLDRPPEQQLRLEACRRELATLVAHLRSLRPADWDAPSACVGWSVHDVAAHLVWIIHRALQHVRQGLDGHGHGDDGPDRNDAKAMGVMTNRLIASEATKIATSGDELVKELADKTSEFIDLFDGMDPEGWSTPYQYRSGGPGGEGRAVVPVSFFMDYRCLETAVHSWDIRWNGQRSLPFAEGTAECVIDVILWSLRTRPFPIRTEQPACIEFRLGYGRVLHVSPGPGGATSFDERCAEPSVSISCSGGTFVLLALGRVRLADEIAHGRATTEGDRSVLSSIDAVYFSDLLLGDLVQRVGDEA